MAPVFSIHCFAVRMKLLNADLIGTGHFPQMVYDYFEVLRRGEVKLLVITPRHHAFPQGHRAEAHGAWRSGGHSLAAYPDIFP